MPRSRSHTKESLTASAMQVFWTHGYEATSLDDLVRATGVSRHGIYGDFGAKHALFVACLDRYQQEVVTPAFARVETPDADLKTVADYFNQQIDLAESTGLPGPGCLIANTMTEVAPHDDAVRACVDAHNGRLRRGFLNALKNELRGSDLRPDAEAGALADMMVVFAQGLWSASRMTGDAGILRRNVDLFLDMIRTRISP